jgi:C4-dicarboxylate transporter DctM subunit
MIMYAVSVGCSVGDIFIAGILPGLLYCGCLGVLAFIRCKRRNYPLAPKATWKVRGAANFRAILALMMPVIILGGIYGGIFTATEAAVVAVVYGLIVGTVIYRELRWKELKDIFLDSAAMAGSLLCMIGIANLFGYVITRERVPQELTSFFMTVINSKITFLLIVNVLFLIIGCIMNTGPAIVVLAPMLAPVAKAYGIDLIHFGVLMIMNCAIGMITPPFGLCLFVISSISKEKFMRVFKETVPCLIVMIGVLVIVTYWSPLSLLLLRIVKS